MHAPIAVAHARLGNLFDALLQNGLAMPVRFVVVGRGINPQNPARPADRNIPFTARSDHLVQLDIINPDHPAPDLDFRVHPAAEGFRALHAVLTPD